MTQSKTPAAQVTAEKLQVVTPDIPKVPDEIVDTSGRPIFGLFEGVPARFDYANLQPPFARNRVTSFLRHKRWMYFFLATDEVIVTAAIADAGLTGTTFVMVTDRATGEVLADMSRPGATGPFVSIGDQPTDGHRSHYALPGSLVTIRGNEEELRLQAKFHDLPFVPLLSDTAVDLDVRFVTDIHPGLTAVAEIQGHDLCTATTKNAALPTRGQLTIRHNALTQIFDLSVGFGGFDYTNGFLPHQTAWRWAFATGKLHDQRTFALNLVADFTGLNEAAQENSVWLHGVLHPVDPTATMTFDEQNPNKIWHIVTADGAVNLEFRPLAIHRENLNIGLIRSKFLQPTGHFFGSISVDGERLDIDGLPGVVEDQDVRW